MANEKEVKAQVRLRFWNVNHERMTATRNVQVTVKKGGSLTLKTLEGLLARADSVAGDKVSSTLHQHSDLSLANDHFYKMRGNGRGSPIVDGCFQIDSRQRHLLPSGRLQLASFGTCCAQEEV
jgi:hypothetical protein